MKQITEQDKPYSLFYSTPDKKFVLYQKPSRAFVYYPNYRINLLNDKKETFSQEDLNRYLSSEKFSSKKNHKIIWHWFYELALPSDQNNLLAIELHYEEATKLSDRVIPHQPLELKLQNQPTYENYLEQYNQIQSELIKGNCYQLNLTHQFIYHFSNDERPLNFFSLWKNQKDRGAFAHATFVPSLNKLFLSNSPECLVQKKANFLFSFPIKGTVLTHLEQELYSEKNCAELDMITDLMRNDLAKLTGEIATVVHKRKILRVPGLLHAYSVIKSDCPESLNLADLVRNVFPGGSITGAPKKRVIDLIREIEAFPRGFYCGSTVLLHGTAQTVSINIRSATVDFSTRQLHYGSGGGITLLSDATEEFRELLAKRDSFINLFSSSNIFLH